MFSIKVADRHTIYMHTQTHQVIDWQ